MPIPSQDTDSQGPSERLRPSLSARRLLASVACVILGLAGDSIGLAASESEAEEDPASTQNLEAADTESTDPIAKSSIDELASAPYAPVMSEPGQRAYLFSIPAPRGLILDRHGLPLARNRSARYLTLRLSQIDAADEASIVELANIALDANPSFAGILQRPSSSRILSQWKHRRGLPLTISGPLSEDLVTELEHSMGPAFSLETVYLRDYPQGERACHIVGHVSREAPQLDGPVVRGESLWPQVLGRSGMEQMYDELLRGSPGLVSELYDDAGSLISRKILRAPRAGQTFVTSIDLEMQKLAEAILKKKGRPGAMVAVDAEKGDILAMASYPLFNPADFVPAISDEKYKELSEHPDNPFFPRASQAVYPPGSSFKPFVALAALDHGTISGSSLISGPPALSIAGRTFRNWNSRHEGMLNVSDALCRSCNTWFYQVAIDTGGAPIVDRANLFGFGRAPDIPIEGTAAGTIPKAPTGKQAIANLSIGQGDVLVSPLQMAVATAGLANGKQVPWPRLVLQTQTPPPNEQVVAVLAANRGQPMDFTKSDLDSVRGGMWSAVNSRSGTGSSAQVAWPQVSGKTGTAQWGAKKYSRNVAWFTGFVNAEKPKIAIAVAIEGKPHVSTAGGRHAAPLAGQFLNTVYGNPQRYAVTIPSRTDASVVAAMPSSRSRSRSSMIQISPDRSSVPSAGRASPTPAKPAATPPPARAQPSQRGGFLSRLRSLFPSSN